MAALKESMQAKGRVKVRDAVRKQNGKGARKGEVHAPVRRNCRQFAAAPASWNEQRRLRLFFLILTTSRRVP